MVYGSEPISVTAGFLCTEVVHRLKSEEICLRVTVEITLITIHRTASIGPSALPVMNCST